jgi:DNA repair protein RecN (Recombination protein N)
MLAIKGVLGDATPVLVFDEVDAGIGGEAAIAVGRRLKRLAQDRQVICVTHQPIIAAMADHHLRICKTQGRDETTVEVVPVQDGEREDELARMLGGSVSEVSRKHARELLASGRREGRQRVKR